MVDSDSPTTGLVMPDTLLAEQQVEPDIEDFDTDHVADPTTPHLELSPLPTLDGEGLVGPYRLSRLIGEGGMGRVYLAADTRTDRVVALKVLKFVGQETLQRRFAREGDVLERLDHPNIVRLLGRGTDERLGLSYLAFEHVQGRDLGVVVKSLPGRRLSVPEVVYVLERCARALAAAHALGILHRDIKLGNVIVTPSAEVKLIDFGIALSDDASVRLSGRDEIMGTLNYIAPDVLQGRGWGPAADIYALGCLAFRVLTGRPAFPGRTPAEIVQAHQCGVPSVAAVRADVPPGLSELLFRMLAPVAEHRPTAEEVAFALGHLGLANETVVVAREWSSGRLGLGFGSSDPTQTEAFGDRPSLTASAEEVMAGRTIGPYQLLRPLGRGAMGEVYLVQHPELGTQYALKLLAAALVEDEEALARFQQEMANLAAVDAHPGIVRVHSSGVTGTGRPYFAMEYVEGETLGRLLRRGLGPVRSLDLLEQVTEALAFAHERGLVHRDVKPDNVLVDETGRARLTDFGLAKAAQGRSQGLTRTGDTIGTPIYMSPEQGKSEHDRVGAWSDVFAMGAILYEVFVGKPPYWGETAIEVYGKLIDGPPIPPARQAGAEIGPGLEAVIQTALAREPEDRYPHAGALLEALREAREADAEGSQGRPVLLWLGLLAAGALVLVFVALLFAEEGSDARSGGDAAVAAAPEVDRAGAVVAAWESGNLDRATALLPSVKGPFRLRHVVLAAAGQPADALAATRGVAAVRPSTRAMLAAWAGDEAAFLSAAKELGADAALALRWRWAAFLPGEPADAWGEKTSGGWRLLARSEQALAEGAPVLAGALLTEAARSSEARGSSLRDHLLWARLRLSLARGQLQAATRAWETLQAHVSSELDRARLRGWGVLLAAAHGSERPASLPTTLGVAARLPIGQLVRGEGGEGERMQNAACLQLGLRRAQVLLTLAERGQVRAGAVRAAALFAAAARLDPRSLVARVGLARAALAAHQVPAAKTAAAAALTLAPRDAGALLVSARCAAAEIEGSPLAVEVDRAWARRRPQREGEAELSQRWGQAVKLFEAALAAARGPQEAEVTLWLGHALVQQADRAQRAGKTTRAIGARVIVLTEGQSRRASAIVEARQALTSALEGGEARAIADAEERLASAAGPAEERLALARSLYLRAVSNAPEARAARQAYLGLAGDLPALALLALRRAERSEDLRARREALQHGLALAPRAAPLLLASELLKLDKESVERFGRDAVSLRGLARAIARGPSTTVAVLTALRASLPEKLPERRAMVRALVGRLPAPSDALARTLLRVAMGGEASSRRALLDAARAERAEPTVAGELLRAIALSGSGSVDAGAIHDALGAARAGAPLSHVVDLVTLHTDPTCEAGDVVDELLAWGYLRNHADMQIPPGAQDSAGASVDLKAVIAERVRPAAKILRRFKLDADYATGALAALEKSDRYRRVSFSLRLYLMAQRVGQALEEAKLKAGLALRPVEDRAHLELFYRYFESRMEGDDALAGLLAETAIHTAARALRERGPAGGCPQPVHSDWELTGQRIDVKRSVGLPKGFKRSFPGHRLDVYSRLRPVAWLRFALVRAWEIADPDHDDDLLLFEPAEVQARWGRSRAALLGVQDGHVAEETVEWLVEEGNRVEAPLALIRSVVFRRTESFRSRYVDELERYRRRMRNLEAGGRQAQAKGLAGLARWGLRWTHSKSPRGRLHEVLADALLLQASAASPAKRAQLGGAAYAEATAGIELGGNGDDRWVLWRLARAAGAKGDRATCAKHVKTLRAAADHHSRDELRKAVKSDPLTPHLKTMPEYQAFVEWLNSRRRRHGRPGD